MTISPISHVTTVILPKGDLSYRHDGFPDPHLSRITRVNIRLPGKRATGERIYMAMCRDTRAARISATHSCSSSTIDRHLGQSAVTRSYLAIAVSVHLTSLLTASRFVLGLICLYNFILVLNIDPGDPHQTQYRDVSSTDSNTKLSVMYRYPEIPAGPFQVFPRSLGTIITSKLQ